MSNEYLDDMMRIDTFIAKWHEEQDFFEQGGEIV